MLITAPVMTDHTTGPVSIMIFSPMCVGIEKRCATVLITDRKGYGSRTAAPASLFGNVGVSISIPGQT